MKSEDTKISEKVYDRTSVFACMCFDSPAEINKAQSFICVLLKRGIIHLSDSRLYYGFNLRMLHEEIFY